MGAGVGLLSLVACRYKPSSVTSTDGNAIVLDILEKNLNDYNINNIPARVAHLEWGSENARRFACNPSFGYPRCDLHQMIESYPDGMSKDCADCGFNCLLIADCTYSVESAALLMETVDVLLSRNGVCLLTHR